MSDPARWSTPSTVVAAVRRRWDDGSLLRAYAVAGEFPRIEVPLRGPGAADLGDHFAAARDWAAALAAGSQGGRAYDLVYGRIGGRLAGVTDVPVRAVVADFAQAWRLLGVARDAEAFRLLVEASAADEPARAWALGSPLRAIALADDWPRLLVAHAWLRRVRGSGVFLRQIDAPGIDTKFVEHHRGVLAAWLEVPAGAAAFGEALGLAAKPATVRARFDPAVLGFPRRVTEATLRAAELDLLPVAPRRALIVENEVTYLSVPVPPGCVALWGRGYDAREASSLRWLSGAEVWYWGDLDTHGFGILNRVRAHLPQVRSILMDRETLLAHEERWGVEDTPTASDLSRLDDAERALFADLVTDRYGRSVRLEQERIDWAWALGRLAVAGWA